MFTSSYNGCHGNALKNIEYISYFWVYFDHLNASFNVYLLVHATNKIHVYKTLNTTCLDYTYIYI